MARYKLLADGQETEGGLLTTRAEVDQWIEDRINAAGLDWRVGYLIKFRDSATVFEWVHARNGQRLSASR